MGTIVWSTKRELVEGPDQALLSPSFPFWRKKVLEFSFFYITSVNLLRRGTTRHGIRNCARICFTVDLEGYRTQSTCVQLRLSRGRGFPKSSRPLPSRTMELLPGERSPPLHVTVIIKGYSIPLSLKETGVSFLPMFHAEISGHPRVKSHPIGHDHCCVWQLRSSIGLTLTQRKAWQRLIQLDIKFGPTVVPIEFYVLVNST